MLAELFALSGTDLDKIAIDGTRFIFSGRPFEYVGLSFFNAIFNQAFSLDTAMRRRSLERFNRYGVSVLRLWGQWDNRRGFVDTDPTATLYQPDGTLLSDPLQRLKNIVADAAAAECVVELALFSRESWDDLVRLEPAGYDRRPRR